MKKLLFFMLIGLTMTSFAQLRKDRTNTQIGGDGAIDNGDGSFKMAFNFTSDLDYGKKGSDNSFKAFQAIALSSEAPVGMVETIKNTKTNRIGSGANFYRLKGMPELLNFSIADSLPIFDPIQEYWKQLNCIVDLDEAATEMVWINYPGMYKKSLFAFRANLTNIGVIGSDLSFELLTYDKGNSGKTATYKMIVELGGKINNGFGNNGFKTAADFDTITSSNVSHYRTALGTEELYVIDSIYTTTIDDLKTKVKINVAEALGMTPQQINGKYVAVMLYTTGTGTNVAPGIYDPVFGIDNIEVSYVPASWILPAGIVANGVIDHNNGSPVVDPAVPATDYSAGAPVEVIADTEAPIKLYLTGINRTGVLEIVEANDGGAHNPKYSFAAANAIKAKDASGNYTVDVPYTYAPSDGTTKFKLTIDAPASGTSVNDTLEVTLNVNLAENAISAERLEITNGTRFWYDISAKGVAPNASPIVGVNAVRVAAFNSNIYTYNAVNDVVVTNLAGQIIKSVSPEVAKKGISMQHGAYIVKTGKLVQKVIVQ